MKNFQELLKHYNPSIQSEKENTLKVIHTPMVSNKIICSIHQWFSNFFRPLPSKFFFYKMRAQYQSAAWWLRETVWLLRSGMHTFCIMLIHVYTLVLLIFMPILQTTLFNCNSPLQAMRIALYIYSFQFIFSCI